MLEFLLELLLEGVFELVAEVVLEQGYRRTAQLFRSRLGRYAIGAAVGAGFGTWWGDHLSAPGRQHGPRLFWVSLAAAVAAGIVAFLRRGAYEQRPVPIRPWRWPAHRFVGLAVMNVAVAVGIAIGYHPVTGR